MIKHIKCNIFDSGADIICHQVNCMGIMGSGIAKQVRQRYPWVYGEYKEFCEHFKPHELLGLCLTVHINETRMIANIFGQERYGYDGKRYTNYDAVSNALLELAKFYPGRTIAIPYMMSCARGGGDWNVIYGLIEDIFSDYTGNILICEYQEA